MSRILAFGLGALAMYLLDPQQGTQRRAWLRERARGMGFDVDSLAAQARGAVRDRLQPEQPSDVPESAHHLGR